MFFVFRGPPDFGGMVQVVPHEPEPPITDEETFRTLAKTLRVEITPENGRKVIDRLQVSL